MEIYAITYQRDMADTHKEKLRFFEVISPFFEIRREISFEKYDLMRPQFPISGKKNSYYEGKYFPKNEEIT